jgi:putative oxidoreductase
MAIQSEVSEQALTGVSGSSAPVSPPANLTAKYAALLVSSADSTPVARDLSLLILRVGFGTALALAHGFGKLSAPDQFIQGLVKRGFPAPTFFGWAALLSEFGGGLLLAFGLLTRPAATLILITLGVAAFDIHAGAPFAKRELALGYAVVALAVLLAGPGRYSLDRRLFGSKRAAAPGTEK